MVYLRPETAQGIYVNYLNVLQSLAAEDPVRHRPDRQGVPQRDHARQLHLPHPRVRADGDAVLREAGHRRRSGSSTGASSAWQWHHDLGLNPAKLRWHQHGPDELAHYAKAAYDIEYEFPFGWQEIEGIHNRGDFDLGRHQEYSGKKLEYFDQAAERALPPVHHRDLRRRRPVDADAAGGRLPRGGGRRARPAWCSASTRRSRRSRPASSRW